MVIPRDDFVNLCRVWSADCALLELVESNVETSAEEPRCADLGTRG
jgi:hypothetical protein